MSWCFQGSGIKIITAFSSDGEKVGAVLDRNGLRPSRYYLTSDNMLILSSEVGVLI